MPLRSPFSVRAKKRSSSGRVLLVGRRAVRALEDEELLPRPALAQRGEQVDALGLLDVVVLPAVRDERRDARTFGRPCGSRAGARRRRSRACGCSRSACARAPRRRQAAGQRPGDRVGSRRRRARQAEVERERRVEALVGRHLGVQEVPDAVLVGVAVPAADRGLRDDRRQARHVGAARGDHVRGRAVVRAADHRDLAVRPRQLGERVDEVDAGLLLLRSAVVPAARRVARAEHVGDRAGVALRAVLLVVASRCVVVPSRRACCTASR